MNGKTPISEIMTKDVITLNYSDGLLSAEKLFKKNKIRHIPVTNGAKMLGMLSYTDLLRISFADAFEYETEDKDTSVYNMFTIEQIMVKQPITVTSLTTIKEVAEILSKKDFHALPVVDKNNLVGIVTTTDLINYLLKQFN